LKKRNNLLDLEKASGVSGAFFYIDAFFVDCSINEFNFLTRRFGAGI
jgi:hypothetical protein